MRRKSPIFSHISAPWKLPIETSNKSLSEFFFIHVLSSWISTDLHEWRIISVSELVIFALCFAKLIDFRSNSLVLWTKFLNFEFNKSVIAFVFDIVEPFRYAVGVFSLLKFLF